MKRFIQYLFEIAEEMALDEQTNHALMDLKKAALDQRPVFSSCKSVCQGCVGTTSCVGSLFLK